MSNTAAMCEGRSLRNILAQWLTFMDNPNTERVDEIVKENEGIKKAKSVLYEMSEDEKLQRLAELREKWELDERSAREYFKTTGLKEGREQGIKEGIKEGIKKGIEEGIEKGIKKGIEEGIEQGKKQKQLEIAQKMKVQNMDIQNIIELTGLTEEEINNL